MKIPNSTINKLRNYQSIIQTMIDFISATDPNSVKNLLNCFRGQFVPAQSDLFQDAYWKGDGKNQLDQLKSINQSAGDPIIVIQSDVISKSSSAQIQVDLGRAKAALSEADRRLTDFIHQVQSAA